MLVKATACASSALRRIGSLGHFLPYGKRLRNDQSGAAMVEFALTVPVLLTLGMYGTELSYLAVTSNNVSQIALNLADSAARISQMNKGVAHRKIAESDVLAIFNLIKVDVQNLDVEENGRVVLTSLERNPDGGQWLHWQRCIGNKTNYVSAYGIEGDGSTGVAITGMGPGSQRVTATAGSAVIYVEIFYEHQPLFGSLFMGRKVLRHEAAFQVRDDRILTGGLTDDVVEDMSCEVGAGGGGGGGDDGSSGGDTGGSTTSSGWTSTTSTGTTGTTGGDTTTTSSTTTSGGTTGTTGTTSTTSSTTTTSGGGNGGANGGGNGGGNGGSTGGSTSTTSGSTTSGSTTTTTSSGPGFSSSH